jgi:hypothetical protein
MPAQSFRFQIESLFPRDSLFLLQQACAINRTKLRFEETVLDVKEEDLTANCDTRDMLGLFWLFGQNVFIGTRREMMT